MTPEAPVRRPRTRPPRLGRSSRRRVLLGGEATPEVRPVVAVAPPAVSGHSATTRRARARRAGPLVLAAVLGVVGVLVGPTAPGAAQEPVTPDPRVIGGEVAPAGTWPSQAAVLEAGVRDPFLAQICGATVIDPSWVLTAAHCVTDYDGGVVPASRVDVLVGTHDLRSGGRRIPVTEVRIRPGFDTDRLINDMALLRLRDAAPVPRDLAVAAPGDIPPSGAQITFAGWGQSDAPGQLRPNLLRQGTSRMMSAAECEAAITEAQAEFPGTPGYHPSHTCIGDIGTGGRGPCFGDSGGPLVWETGGRRILVGLVSWGVYCASPETPSVAARVSSGTDWIAATIRYGPHPSSAALGEVFSSLFWLGQAPVRDVDPLVVMEGVLRAPPVERREAAIVRLYRSVLDRPADEWGFDYWRERVASGGASLTRVAEVMARSAEFRATYGALDDGAFVARLYENVLGRPADPSGSAYWVAALGRGASRGGVAARFSESAEHRVRTRGDVDTQVVFLVALDRAPSAAALATWSVAPTRELLDHILHSYGYAHRVRFGGVILLPT